MFILILGFVAFAFSFSDFNDQPFQFEDSEKISDEELLLLLVTQDQGNDWLRILQLLIDKLRHYPQLSDSTFEEHIKLIIEGQQMLLKKIGTILNRKVFGNSDINELMDLLRTSVTQGRHTSRLWFYLYGVHGMMEKLSRAVGIRESVKAQMYNEFVLPVTYFEKQLQLIEKLLRKPLFRHNREYERTRDAFSLFVRTGRTAQAEWSKNFGATENKEKFKLEHFSLTLYRRSQDSRITRRRRTRSLSATK
ncbi:hypothetical protein EIN_205780 [Entamoeba invadens IP1]|uniref:Uncharacterized protein n=1 Tax=Entamoeba invadens IP1 TaxID=370355 RepID=A0A0A1U9G1_ENTIV|nr:hypothetical protein EIN_205780 [Entamoeba invadens IP1]ELP91621.1 hypothetical protein EIN_205780 [Entamoeba invadens IP1]|eukprot:XP_004258392.1 hypothetical protein EIN_205780 [Entamoeba invadens IP1]